MDIKEMPLGKLSKNQLNAGFDVLKEIKKEIKGENNEFKLKDATNRFYTVIPHHFDKSLPPILTTLEQVKEKIAHLEVIPLPSPLFLYSPLPFPSFITYPLGAMLPSSSLFSTLLFPRPPLCLSLCRSGISSLLPFLFPFPFYLYPVHALMHLLHTTYFLFSLPLYPSFLFIYYPSWTYVPTSFFPYSHSFFPCTESRRGNNK